MAAFDATNFRLLATKLMNALLVECGTLEDGRNRAFELYRATLKKAMKEGQKVKSAVVDRKVTRVAAWEQPKDGKVTETHDEFCKHRMNEAFVFSEAEVLAKTYQNIGDAFAKNWEPLKWHTDMIIRAQMSEICFSDIVW